MKGAVNSVLEAIGNTPIVKLNPKFTGVESEIYVKLEYLNPGGSTKDRIGNYIMQQAVKNGVIKPGGTIIEGTSGNTGVGLAMFAAIHGYKCIFTLADKQSQEKINNLRSFGAKVIVCPTNVAPEDPRSYYSVAKRLAETIPNSYYVNQYDNLWNRQTHENTTGPEIWQQTNGDFDAFVAGAGTGGTITGIGLFLKSKSDKIKVIGVDIEGSILAHYAKTGKMAEAKPYVLEGVGEDFIPQNYDFSVIDDWVVCSDKESFVTTRALLKHEGIYAGGSSGFAVAGAIKYAKSLKTPQKILVLLPDSGNRYISKIYNDEWMANNGYLDSSFNVMAEDVLKQVHKGSQQLITISDGATVDEAIQLMDKHGISQLPVVGQDTIKGIVTEKDLLKPVFQGQISLKDSISVAYNSKFKTIDKHELLSTVTDALLKKETVIVTSANKPIAVLTDIDVLHYIQSQNL